MKSLTKDTWQIIRQNWKNILLFELLYRGITTSVYMRLVSRGIRLALRAAGYSYLTPANIGNFLIRPVTPVSADSSALYHADHCALQTGKFHFSGTEKTAGGRSIPGGPADIRNSGGDSAVPYGLWLYD